MRAGQELTHFKLLPGEEIRTPLMVLQFWKGDRLHAQNVWRSWMLAHNLPRPGGKLPPVELAACSSHQFGEMIHANTENQKFFVDRYLKEGLKLDYWWMDAGWYFCDPVGWPKTGTWEVDTRRFPHGFREISDHAHAKDVKTIVWFEPERVHPDTWLTQNHPEWILGGKGGHFRRRVRRYTDCRRATGRPAEPRPPRGMEMARRPHRHVDHRAGHRPVSPGLQHRSVELLAGQRRRRSPGHHRNQARDRLPRLLGRAAAASSQHAHRFVRERRPSQRPGNAPPRRAPAAKRLHYRTGGQPGPHLRHRLLDALLRHRHGSNRFVHDAERDVPALYGLLRHGRKTSSTPRPAVCWASGASLPRATSATTIR